MKASAIVKNAMNIAIQNAGNASAGSAKPVPTATPAAAPVTPTTAASPAVAPVSAAPGQKVAYVTHNGEPLFTIEESLGIISKAANILVEEERRDDEKSAAHEESVDKVRALLRAASQIPSEGDKK